MIFTIAIEKGGTCKTTLAVHFATWLVLKGKRVVLVDLDPQGNVAKFLGLEPKDDVAQLLRAVLHLEPRLRPPIREFLTPVPSYERLVVIRGHKRTAKLEGEFQQLDMQQQPAQVENPAVQVLREALLPFQRVPGVHVVLDTAPFAGALQEAALVVADHVIVPGIPERATESGLMDIARTLNRLDRAIMGVVPTKIVRSGSGETEHERTIQDWRNALGPVVYYDPGADLHGLPRRVIWGQLVRYGLPIWDVAPFCDAAQEMSAVLRRIAYDAKIEKAS